MDYSKDYNNLSTKFFDAELVSNCCSAEVNDYDICSACGEPCEAVETE